ncbi:sirohydrochlorin chelatase [Streptomyces piniterrae]|uniref:Sirohydrochlorin chelatase n=1 Tax=Streptomyces piniterrae TaxID=2571125 RepID=A0A4V5ML35_9ACTN|nr:CbiX/SirB N-terminal domain-containing protein [Streptomyces piniterrae]TJZ55698.1 sirohydrochlorin chelatase [Streptomyces piniterrae]
MTESISHQPDPAAPIDLAQSDDPAADGDRPAGGAPAPLGPAHLATEITAQLSTQLSKVRLYGFRRPAEAARARPAARPARSVPAPTLVAVAHGSRDPRAVHTVSALLDRVRALRPDLPVRLGHIELNRPLLADTLAGLRGEAVLVPLLFGRGYHVTHDLPAELAAAPHLTGRIAAPLGPHALLAEALHGRLLEAGFGDGPRMPADHGTSAECGTCTGPRSRSGIGRDAVVLAAAGSRAARSADDIARTAQLLSARLGGIPVLPAFASAAGPTVAEAVRILTARGHDRIAVASCFTAPGRFAAQCAAAAPGIAAAPLGDHPALARLVLHRYDQALFARTASDQDGIRAATVAV